MTVLVAHKSWGTKENGAEVLNQTGAGFNM